MRQRPHRSTSLILRPNWGLLAVCITAVGLLVAPAAKAKRVLKEPASIRAIPRMVPQQKQQAGLDAAKIADQCKKQLKARTLEGVRCRLAIHRTVSKEIGLADATALKRRIQAAKESLTVAQSVSAYKPVKRKPGHKRALYEAHKAACAVALDTADALGSLPAGAPADVRAAAKAALEGSAKKPGLFVRSCECARDTIVLSEGAVRSVEEKGAAQHALTSRGCFLDKSKVAVKRGGPDSAFTGAAKGIAAANTVEALLLDYAATRDVGLNRCRQKAMSNGTLTDKAKMEKCACNEIKRYKFPKERGRKDVTVVIPIAKDQLGVSIVVNAPGKVASCGPLSGPLAR